MKAKRRRAAGAPPTGAAGERRDIAFGFSRDEKAVKVKTEAVDVVKALIVAGRYEDAADLVLQHWGDRVRRLAGLCSVVANV